MSKLPDFHWTIPNALSVFRIACAPVMVMLALLDGEHWFVVLFVVAQITDILDGFLARALNQESEIGVLLDSYGDVGSYVAAVSGLIIFHPEIFSPPYGAWCVVFAALYVADLIIGKIKYGRLVTGLHLYSAKAMGYLQGTFFVVLFVWKFVPAFFFVMIAAGILSLIEGILINLIAQKPVLNAKGLYWVFKDERLK